MALIRQKEPVEAPPTPKKQEKAVTITLQGLREPTYVFHGEWVGADVRLVMHGLHRAYRKQQLAQRRQLFAASDQTVALSAKENTNG